MSAAPKREADLGPPIVAWFERERWDVYQEVEGPRGCADIVATCGRLIAVIELKLALTFELLWQARRWRGFAHFVFVGVPHAKSSDGRAMAEQVFGEEGIGVLSVQESIRGARVMELRRPAFCRTARTDIRADLRPEQKRSGAAGSPSGGPQWTPFRGTCERVREYLAEHPGATIREVVAEVEHHYANDAGARARLVSLIERGVIAGIRIERDGRTPRLYATALGVEP